MSGEEKTKGEWELSARKVIWILIFVILGWTLAYKIDKNRLEKVEQQLFAEQDN